MPTYDYFISYTTIGAGLGFGSIGINLPTPILTQHDVDAVVDSIARNMNRNVVILNWRPYPVTEARIARDLARLDGELWVAG